jgi:hypothetical protein
MAVCDFIGYFISPVPYDLHEFKPQYLSKKRRGMGEEGD